MRRLLLLASLLTAALPLAAQRIPLNDMSPTDRYLGFSGGLYPDGNVMPEDHRNAGLAFAATVNPLDTAGRPSPAGKIAMLSIGMSNTTQEFCAAGNPAPCASWSFVGQARADAAVDKTTLVFVNGARGGQTADTWDSPSDMNYIRVRDENLTPAGLTEAQVQVAWVKVANARPTVSLPNENADAYRLVAQIGDIVRALKTRYPNLKLVYLSSRIYAGFATTVLNPEPYAYESGFAVKWIVEAQIRQMRDAAIDLRTGDLDYNSVAPWIAWGPYLWANGQQPRSDGLFWIPSDFEGDGTHPARGGEEKVGQLLLSFFKSEPTARGWFLVDTPRRRGVRR